MIDYYIANRNYRQIGDSEKKIKYFARLDEKIMLDTDELCQRVADRSTLAKGEMRLALDMLCEMAIDALKNGRSVRLGDLGILHPVINARVQDRKEDVTAKTIKEVNCNLRVSRRLKRELNDVAIRKIELPTTEIQTC